MAWRHQAGPLQSRDNLGQTPCSALGGRYRAPMGLKAGSWDGADPIVQARLMWEWRPTRFAVLRRTVLGFVVACLALALTAWVLPGLQVDGLGALVLGGALLAAANAAAGLTGHWLFVRLPILVVQVAGFAVEFVGILVVGRVVPGIHVDSLATALVGTLLLTLLNGFLADVVSVSDDDSYYSVLVRRLIARRGIVAAAREPGLLVVQLDGVGRPVLEGALRAGHMPNVDRMLRSGDAALHSWRPRLPPTTPASQAGILHGNGDAIPGFRWYEKETGRVLVANHPEDASAVLERISDGRGLLADDGASIGNLFTGDAPRSYLTMATIRAEPPPADERRARGFFVSTINYTRLAVLTLGEILKELYQAEHQRGRDVAPRMHRDLHYAVERAVTNVGLRTVSTALVIEEMYRGAPAIFVDYTAYDAVAHHCGPERRESIDALEGLDRAIGSILKAEVHATRQYHVVLLSDHGQSMGPSFRQRYGQPVEALLGKLLPGDAVVVGSAVPAETAGSGRRIAAELGRGTGFAPFLARQGPAILKRVRVRTDDGDEASVKPDAVVCASGSLAHIYFAKVAGRMTRSAIERAYPGLIATLTSHPGIGAILVRTDDGHTVAVGANGERELSTGSTATGEDPLAQFGADAAEALAQVDDLEHAGDLMLLGRLDPASGQVVGLEELVGSHGGLGGWQTQPFILCPEAWQLAADPLEGAPAVYQQLRIWLAALGTDATG